MSRSQVPAVVHDPDDDYLDADHQILSPPAREISRPSIEVLLSSFHPSTTLSAARHFRRRRLSCQESRANSLVQTPYFEAALIIYFWWTPIISTLGLEWKCSYSELQIMHMRSQLQHPTSSSPIAAFILSGRYSALVTFYFVPIFITAFSISRCS